MIFIHLHLIRKVNNFDNFLLSIFVLSFLFVIFIISSYFHVTIQISKFFILIHRRILLFERGCYVLEEILYAIWDFIIFK